MRLMLVYQGGIANVFRVARLGLTAEDRGFTTRVMQSDFHSCELLVSGARLGGAEIMIAGCNEAGDIAEREWTTDLENLPFHDQFIHTHEAIERFVARHA